MCYKNVIIRDMLRKALVISITHSVLVKKEGREEREKEEVMEEREGEKKII